MRKPTFLDRQIGSGFFHAAKGQRKQRAKAARQRGSERFLNRFGDRDIERSGYTKDSDRCLPAATVEALKVGQKEERERLLRIS